MYLILQVMEIQYYGYNNVCNLLFSIPNNYFRPTHKHKVPVLISILTSTWYSWIKLSKAILSDFLTVPKARQHHNHWLYNITGCRMILPLAQNIWRLVKYILPSFEFISSLVQYMSPIQHNNLPLTRDTYLLCSKHHLNYRTTYLYLHGITEHLTFNTEYLTFSTENLTFSTEHLTFSTEHPSFNTEHLTFTTGHLTFSTVPVAVGPGHRELPLQ